MKKIAIFSTEICNVGGGIETMAFNLVKYLSEDNNVLGYSSNKVKNKLENVTYVKGKLLNIFSIFKVLKLYINENKNQKFDTNISLTWKVGLITYIIKKIFNIPYIVYIHGNEIYYENVSRIYRFLIKKVLKNANLVIANSNYTAKMSQKYGDINVKVIHPGIEYETIVKNVSNVKKNSDKEIILLTVGRVVERKGVGTVVKALKYVINEYDNIKYIVAGKGEFTEEIIRISKEENVSEYVTIMGEVTQEKKYELYNECDLFVMPSFEIKERGDVEGFGIVYLEANAFGKFAIGGNEGGSVDAIIDGKTGFSVDGRNPEQVAEAIIKFLKNYHNKEIYSKDCIKWAKEHDWKIISKKINEIGNV